MKKHTYWCLFYDDIGVTEIKGHFGPPPPTSQTANSFSEHQRQQPDSIRRSCNSQTPSGGAAPTSCHHVLILPAGPPHNLPLSLFPFYPTWTLHPNPSRLSPRSPASLIRNPMDSFQLWFSPDLLWCVTLLITPTDPMTQDSTVFLLWGIAYLLFLVSCSAYY